MTRGDRGQNATLDDFVSDFASGPLRNWTTSVLGSFTGEADDLAALLSSDLDWPTRAGHVTETLVQRELGERNGSEGEPAIAPEADGIDLKVEGAGDLGVIVAISGGENDAGALGKLL